MYTYMCPILNGLRNRAIWLYSSKIVDKKNILRTVSNTSIYPWSEKFVKVCLVQYIFGNSASLSIHFVIRVKTWRVVGLCSERAVSGKIFWNRAYVHIIFLLRSTDSITSHNNNVCFWDILYMRMFIIITINWVLFAWVGQNFADIFPDIYPWQNNMVLITLYFTDRRFGASQ
jgi:hypothetical protein